MSHRLPRTPLPDVFTHCPWPNPAADLDYNETSPLYVLLNQELARDTSRPNVVPSWITQATRSKAGKSQPVVARVLQHLLYMAAPRKQQHARRFLNPKDEAPRSRSAMTQLEEHHASLEGFDRREDPILVTTTTWAKELGCTDRAIRESVTWITAQGWFNEARIEQEPERFLIINQEGMAKAFAEHTTNAQHATTAREEFEHGPLNSWTASQTSELVLGGVMTRVPALLSLAIPDRTAARLISQLLWWQCHSGPGGCEAIKMAKVQLVGGGVRWWETNKPQLAAALGISTRQVRRWLQRLSRRGLIQVTHRKHHRRGLLVRPGVNRLLELIIKTQANQQPTEFDDQETEEFSAKKVA